MPNLDEVATILDAFADRADASLLQPTSRRAFGAACTGIGGILVSLLGFPTLSRASSMGTSSVSPRIAQPQDSPLHHEHPSSISEFESRLCSGWQQGNDFAQIDTTKRAEENVPSRFFTQINTLSSTHREKVQTDIFQQHIYELYEANRDAFSKLFCALGVPAHRHFLTYCILQVLFATYMADNVGKDAVYRLTLPAFSHLIDHTHVNYISSGDLSTYLQQDYTKKNPKLSGSEAVFYNPVSEVVGAELPAPQQYTIHRDTGSNLPASPRRPWNTATSLLRESGFGFSSSRTAGTNIANVYARDMTCTHGCTDDVIAYMKHLRMVVNQLSGPDMVVPMVISGVTEPGHGLTSTFSQNPRTAGYLVNHLNETTAVLTTTERDKIAKTHGSGNKIDISSRGFIGYLLSTYFGLWKEGSVVTKKETIKDRTYIIEARYHLGHFDICVLSETLYNLTK